MHLCVDIGKVPKELVQSKKKKKNFFLTNFLLSFFWILNVTLSLFLYIFIIFHNFCTSRFRLFCFSIIILFALWRHYLYLSNSTSCLPDSKYIHRYLCMCHICKCMRHRLFSANLFQFDFTMCSHAVLLDKYIYTYKRAYVCMLESLRNYKFIRNLMDRY